MLDPAGTDYDPGIAPLRTDRLALAMREVQVRRRDDWPERAMRSINFAFWLLFWLAVAILVPTIAVVLL